MPEDSKHKTTIHGNVEKLTQIENVEGNVITIISSDLERGHSLAVSSLLSQSQSDWNDVALAKAHSECRKQVKAHLAGLLTDYEATSCSVPVSMTHSANDAERVWKDILIADDDHRRLKDALELVNVEILRACNALPTGKTAEWVGALQHVESHLADLASQSRETDKYNETSSEIIQEVWAPTQPFIDTTAAVTGPVLYTLTRLRVNQRRFQHLKPERANPFTPLLQLMDDGVFPIGMQEDGGFLFAIPERLSEQELIRTLSIPPILTGLHTDNPLGIHQIGGELVARFPQQRIDNRITNLESQILAGQFALRRHLGCWSQFWITQELLYTAFDPDGLASLLNVIANSLKQLRLLTNPSVGKTSIRLSSLDVVRARFDDTQSIWCQKNALRVTQMTGREHANKCLDPIIDFHLINYSNVPRIINEIVLRHYGTWSEAKAIPVYGLLKSIKTYNIRGSFSKPISSYHLDPPIFIAPNSPGRFKVRLVNFARECPGSDTFIQFGLRHGNEICDTPIFHMDIRGGRI